MTEHDGAVAHAEGPGGADVFQVAPAEELGADHVHQAHPGKQQHDAQQPPEVRLDEAGQDDQQVEHRQPRPDFQETLAEQVDPAAVVALQGADGDADQRTEHGQGQGEEDRHAEAVDNPGEHVAGLVVGAQPVFRRRRGGGGNLQLVVDGVVAVGDRRPKHPAVLLGDQLADVGALVVGFQGEFAAEGGFRVAFEDREVPAAVVMHDQRFVVGDQFGAEAADEQDEEQPERPPAALVALEAGPAALVDGRQAHRITPGSRSRCADRPGCRRYR